MAGKENSESLKANMPAATSGAARNTKERHYVELVACQKGSAGFDRHQLLATVLLSVWPESFRPIQITREVNASSTKPNAAPDSQL